ncbi:MAG: 50S ribosomal protein L6 [Deltaproteobacteria bacterium]|nr:MAG: 50S ribosomal protein L6 [Deltaproteobacteria bacterium]
MSRIGNKPVELPKGVTFQHANGEIVVKGPRGSISRKVVAGIDFEEQDSTVVVRRAGDTPQLRANHGLMRSLLASMVEGVSKGFERRLDIVGVGYKAEVKGRTLVLNLGYSHPVEFAFPEGIDIEVGKNNKIFVRGIDKERVGQAAAVIRSFRPPDSYKGKGVRYEGEYVRIKAGKSGQ